MFVCRNIRQNSGSVGQGFFFFLSVCVCESLLFPNKNKNSSGAKNNGLIGRFFFFLEIAKKKKSAGFSRVGRVTANKQCFFFMPNSKYLQYFFKHLLTMLTVSFYIAIALQNASIHIASTIWLTGCLEFLSSNFFNEIVTKLSLKSICFLFQPWLCPTFPSRP